MTNDDLFNELKDWTKRVSCYEMVNWSKFYDYYIRCYRFPPEMFDVYYDQILLSLKKDIKNSFPHHFNKIKELLR